jgi:spore maturation protein CgeB
MERVKKVLFVDSGTTFGQGGWQISRGAFEGLKSLGVEAELFQLSARLGLMRAAFSCLAEKGTRREYDERAVMEWSSGTLAERALLFKPDLVVAMKGTRISESALAALKAAGIPCAAWTLDDPYELERYLLWSKHYDFIFTSEPRCLPVYEAFGVQAAEFLPHAHDPAVHKPDPAAAASANYSSDICFIGAAYPERVKLLKAAAPLLARHKTVLIGNWGVHRGELPGVRVLEGFVPESEAVKFYSGAKIVLNIHRLPGECAAGAVDPAKVGADGVNSRTFEIAGTGAFQLADAVRRTLKEHFVPGREIETFTGAEELLAKIERYLADAPLRCQIAAAGRRRALAGHTYGHRMKKLLEAVENSRVAAARL